MGKQISLQQISAHNTFFITCIRHFVEIDIYVLIRNFYGLSGKVRKHPISAGKPREVAIEIYTSTFLIGLLHVVQTLYSSD